MKIVVLDRKSIGDDTPINELSKLGELVVYDFTPSEQLTARISDADVVVINKIKMTSSVIKAAKKLKLICEFATGFDNIDVETARECGVAVTNVPGYSTDSVVLFTFATVLALVTHIREYSDYVNSGAYTASGCSNALIPVYHELKGKTWGIVGCGNIGGAVLRVAEAFGARVLVNKRTPSPEFECVDIDTLCAESDIITIHCPLNENTRALINKERIALMKRDVIIVNEARGAVLCEADIADAVLSGRIGGFGSDVYSEEPFSKEHPFSKIMGLSNVLLTPHAAWGAYESRARCLKIICENITSFLNGGAINRVDLK